MPGTLEAAVHKMLYLLLHYYSRLYMDPTYPMIDGMKVPVFDRNKLYDEVEEPFPPNVSEAIVEAVELCMFVDIDHT